jgi:transposase-like protein
VKKEQMMREQKNKKHPQYSIDEKNQIVLLYRDRHMGMTAIQRQYNIPHKGVIQQWIKQYREFGTCVDRRGKRSVGRPKKDIERLEDMSKKDLIEKVRLYENIKKSLAYLMNQAQNKNIK